MALMYNESILDFDLDLLKPQASSTNVSDQSENNNCEISISESDARTKGFLINSDDGVFKGYMLKETVVSLKSSLHSTKSTLNITSGDLLKTRRKLKEAEKEINNLKNILKANENQQQVDKETIKHLENQVNLLNNIIKNEKSHPIKEFNRDLPELDECFRNDVNDQLRVGEISHDNTQIAVSPPNQKELHIDTNHLPFIEIKPSRNDSYVINAHEDNDTGCGSSLASPSDGEMCFSMNNSPLNTDISDKSNRICVDVATSPLPFYHINVATSPIQSLKSVDVTTSPIQETNIKETFKSNNVISHETDMDINYSLTNNSFKTPTNNTKIGNNEMCAFSLEPAATPYKDTEMHNHQRLPNIDLPIFDPNKRSLQLNTNENCDEENSSDNEVEIILNKMRFNERMITPLPSTPVKQGSCKTYEVLGLNVECQDVARMAELFVEILKSNGMTIPTATSLKEPVLSSECDCNENSLNITEIHNNKKSSLNNMTLQNHIQTPISKNNEYKMSNPIKTKKTHSCDYTEFENSQIILNENIENHGLEINDPSNNNIQSKKRNIVQTLCFDNNLSPNRDDSSILNSGDDIEECQLRNKLSNIPKMLKQRKLTKLDKFRKKLIPKSKIRVTSPPVKKLRKMRKQLLITETLADKEVTDTLKNKNALDNAIKVITELKHHQNSKELKQCTVSLNAIDLRELKTCKHNKIVSKCDSTSTMPENKIQNANSKMKIQIIENILITDGGKKYEMEKNNSNHTSSKIVNVSDNLRKCMSPKRNYTEISIQKNKIVSESPSSMTIHRDGNISVITKLQATESKNPDNIGSAKSRVNKLKTSIPISENDVIFSDNKLKSPASSQKEISTCKLKCPEESNVIKNYTTKENSISQINIISDVQQIQMRKNSVDGISNTYIEEDVQQIGKRKNSADITTQKSNEENIHKIGDSKTSADYVSGKSNAENLQQIENRKNSANSIPQRSNEEDIQQFGNIKNSTDSISNRNNKEDIQKIKKKKKNSGGSISHRSDQEELQETGQRFAYSSIQKGNEENIQQIGKRNNLIDSVLQSNNEDVHQLGNRKNAEDNFSQSCNEDGIQKTRKRKNSADKPVPECKRMLRSSTLRTSRSGDQCVKLANPSDINKSSKDERTNVELHDTVEAASRNSQTAESINIKDESGYIHPKESILCLMLDKYGKKSGKNCNKKMPEDPVSAISKTIHDEITTILSSPANEAKQHMNKFIAIIRKWHIKYFMAGLMQYLKDPQRKVELYNKVSSAPAPPMTKSEQVLLCIIIHLSVMSTAVDIVDCILSNIEYVLFKLNRTPEFDTIDSMSHFYAIVCRYFHLKSRLRTFMLDAMYCIQFKAVPVVKQCLDVWAHVLPLSHMGIAKSSLVTCMVYLLHFYKCEDRFNRVQEIRYILCKKYNYDIKDWNEPKILEMLKNAIIKVRAIPVELKLLRITLIVIAKRHGPKWCQNNIIKKILLPFIENESSPERVRNFCIMMLGPLLKPFPMDMKVHSEIVINMLVDMLNQSPSPATEEAIYTSLIYMSRHSLMRVLQVLIRWRPKQITPDFESLMKDFVSEKPLKVWKAILCKVSLI